MHIFGITIHDLNPYPCALYTYAGLYCPGCGGTRAVGHLLHGRILQSFIYHPVVPYTAAVVGCYVVSHTLNIVTKGKIRAMLFRPIYLYLTAAITLINWIVKDALILLFGIYLLG